MTPTEHITAWFENVWNKRDETYLRKHLQLECFEPESEVRGIGTPTEGRGSAKAIKSVDEFVAFWKGLLDAIDSMNVETTRLTECGDEASGIATITGQDRKSGHQVSFQLGFWIRVKDDVIVAAENVVDFHRYLVQVLPEYENALAEHLGSQA